MSDERRDVQDLIPTRLSDQPPAEAPTRITALANPDPQATLPATADPAATQIAASTASASTGGTSGVYRQGTGTITRLGRTRTNTSLPLDTQQLDVRLQCSRTSVLADMGRIDAGRLPPGVRKLIDEHGTEGRYAIDKPLAQGGMGAVLLIRDGDFQRPAAMKVMLSRFAANAQALERFLQEAQVTAQLEHPNIVPIHDLGIMEDGTVYFTMKFIEGESLGSIVKRRKNGDAAAIAQWSEERILLAFLKVLDGVGYAHHKGVVHRDIKPDNIMIGPHGEVLVVDWGIAKVLGRSDDGSTAAVVHLRSDEALSQTMEGSAMGTAFYMPPEQATGDLARIGPCSDIYALGATLYELLTLARPVGGGSAAEVLARITTGELTPIKQAAPALHDDLAAIVMQALALEPERRYATCDAFAADLRSYLAGQAVLARQRNLIERIGAWVGRHRKQVALGSAGLAVAGGALAVGLQLGATEQNRRLDAQLAEAQAAVQAGNWELARNLALAITGIRPGGAAEAIKDQAQLELGKLQQIRDAEQQAQGRQVTAHEKLALARAAEVRADWATVRDLARTAIALAQLPEAITLLGVAERHLLEAAKADRERAAAAHKADGDRLLAEALVIKDLNADALPDLIDRITKAYATAGSLDVVVPGLERAATDLGALKARREQAVEQAGRDRAAREQATRDRAQADAALAAAEAALGRNDPEAAAEQIAIARKLAPGDERGVQLRERASAQVREREAAQAAEAARAKARATAATALAQARAAAERMQAAAAERQRQAARVDELVRSLADQPLERKQPLFAARAAAATAATAIAEQWALAEGAARTAADSLAGEPDHADARAARELLISLYRGRLAEAHERGALPEIAAFTNLLGRLGVRDDTRTPGRLNVQAPAGVTVTVWPLGDDGSGRFTAAGTPVANSSELPPGRYEVRWGADAIASVVIAAGQTVQLALPARPAPDVGQPLRWVPPIANARGFWLAEHEVTVAQYVAFIADPAVWARVQEAYAAADANDGTLALLPRVGPLDSTWQLEVDANKRLVKATVPQGVDRNRPITGVSRADAEAFCAWLAARSARKVRLPSSAEFTQAASGGDRDRIHAWGPGFDHAFCVSALPQRSDVPAVGSAPADRGPFGHRDLAGSVREWTSGAGLAHPGQIAGGSWADELPQMFTTAFRESVPVDTYNAAIGFRILVEEP